MNQGGPPNDDPMNDGLAPSAELHALEADIEVESEPPLLPQREPFHTFFRILGRVEEVVGALLLLTLLVLVMAIVIQRYLRTGWPGTGELARYMMVWGTFLIAGYLVAYPPGHITIGVVDYLVKGRWLGVFKLLADVVIVASSVVVLYGGYQLLANDVGQKTPAAGMPLYWVNLIPVVGFVLILLRGILAIVVRDVPTLLGRDVKG